MSDIILGGLPVTSIEAPYKLADRFYGQGSVHPVGLTHRDALFNFYLVKKYYVNIYTVAFYDPLLIFLASVGSPTDIIAALTGLELVNKAIGAKEFDLNGLTTIVEEDWKTPIKNPHPSQGVCGFRHKLDGNESAIRIDYSRLLIGKDGKFYPRIYVAIGPNSSINDPFMDLTLKSAPVSTNSLVLFDGYGMEMFSFNPSTLILGRIEPYEYF
jgi:hypothetical protein